MKPFYALIAALLIGIAPPSFAQQMSELACADFKPSPEALERFPDLIGACEAIVEREGELYGKFTAEVRRVRGSTATLYLPATDHTFKVSPDSAARVLVEGRKTRVRDLVRGQEIRIYLAVSEFAKPDIEEVILVTESNILVTTEIEPAPMLPKTASLLPTIGLAGLVFLGAALLFRRQRLTNSGNTLLGLAVLSLSLAGVSPAVEADSHVAVKPARITTSVIRTAAIVEAVDMEMRQLKLIDASGRRFTTKVGDEVINFDQIQPRDRIVMEYLDSVAIVVTPKGTPEAAQGVAVEVAAEGEKPSISTVETFMVKADVLKLNLTKRQATLQYEDGSVETIHVSSDVPMELVEVGDEVRIRVTHALAVSVRKVGAE
ncbi:hypothetical protein EYC98_04405 [Halieaceae bacterium IMCC14734]|uniref:Uncharacterized protein n=1 Tax=Candidatus Litorirhabdus singularis TaxID=2518993 RepID=A0ABT3TE54_9GAMM|nr:hypothetical protein [Candidatus Litorirhabdus singularis]MCX2980105.1 hypothetical protein [Candidatus Litorirhabdus singularis]